MGNIFDEHINEPIPTTLTEQNHYHAKFNREYHNPENRIIYSTTQSISFSSTSMPISPPLDLVQHSTSLQLNQNNSHNWSYQ